MPRTRTLLAAVLLVAPIAASAASGNPPDASLRLGWELIAQEKFAEARDALRRIEPAGYDLGDYAVYLTGLALVRGGDRKGGEAVLERLGREFPESPLVPYLYHELAFAAAKDNDVAGSKPFFDGSRGRVSGNGRRCEEGYVAARLLEDGGAAVEAARAHLENFASSPAQDGAILSMERLWGWREAGKFREWQLPAGFLGKFAEALSRAAEADRAGSVYEEVVRELPPSSDDYFSVLVGYAEFLRRKGETKRSRELLDRVVAEGPAALRSEAEFLQARVEWRAGRLKDARAMFLAIAGSKARPSVAERARYLAAWLALEDDDLAAATAEFGRLREARDESIRQEGTFRYAFGLYRMKRYPEALAAFAEGGAKGFSSVERARHAYWRGRALVESGRKEEGEAVLASVAGDPGAGPYALFAQRDAGKDPFAMFRAPGGGETAACGENKSRLWEHVRDAPWSERDARIVRRASRLVDLGILEYAILEAERIDRVVVRKTIGLADGATAGLFRYLAGDLKGALRETSNLPNDLRVVEVIDRIQYPLAPELVGDCERRKSGIDPLVLHAIIRQESQFQANALSSAGAVGLMQLMPRTAAETARREKMRPPRRKDLLRPDANVALGAAYLSRLLKDYGGDYFRAVAAYNAGESSVARWWEASGRAPALFLESISFKETRFYVRRVFLNLLQYYLIYRPRLFGRYFPTPAQGAPPVPDVAEPPPSAAVPVLVPGLPASAEGAPGGAPTPPPPAQNPSPPEAPAPAPR